MSAIKDINLAPSGAHKIDWVRKNCPLLRSLEDDFSKERPFGYADHILPVYSHTMHIHLNRQPPVLPPHHPAWKAGYFL